MSQSAVSLVISGKAGTRVSAKTAARILEAADELGYAPNAAAAMLRTGLAPTLALAVPTVTQPFFSSVLLAAERRARESGYSMILLNSGSDEQWVKRLADMLRGGVLAGAIAYGARPAEAQALADTGLPVVLADAGAASGLPLIEFDFSQGMTEAARHLGELGHTAIGYLAANGDRFTYRRRRQAFTSQVVDQGGAVVAVQRSASLDFDDAVHAGRELLRSSPGVTAVMCDDDLLAAALIRAAAPGTVGSQLSVIGVGDIDLARMTTPELTTVELSAADIGAGAVDLLLSEQPTARQTIGARLVVRGSTGAVG